MKRVVVMFAALGIGCSGGTEKVTVLNLPYCHTESGQHLAEFEKPLMLWHADGSSARVMPLGPMRGQGNPYPDIESKGSATIAVVQCDVERKDVDLDSSSTKLPELCASGTELLVAPTKVSTKGGVIKIPALKTTPKCKAGTLKFTQ